MSRIQALGNDPKSGPGAGDDDGLDHWESCLAAHRFLSAMQERYAAHRRAVVGGSVAG